MPITILRFDQLQHRLKISRATIYNRINPRRKTYDPTFPKPIPIGPRLVGWVESEIDAWIDNQIKASRSGIGQDS